MYVQIPWKRSSPLLLLLLFLFATYSNLERCEIRYALIITHINKFSRLKSSHCIVRTVFLLWNTPKVKILGHRAVLRTVVFLLMTPCKLIASYAVRCGLCIKNSPWAIDSWYWSIADRALFDMTCWSIRLVCDVAVRLQYSVCRHGIEWSVSFTYSVKSAFWSQYFTNYCTR